MTVQKRNQMESYQQDDKETHLFGLSCCKYLHQGTTVLTV